MSTVSPESPEVEQTPLPHLPAVLSPSSTSTLPVPAPPPQRHSLPDQGDTKDPAPNERTGIKKIRLRSRPAATVVKRASAARPRSAAPPPSAAEKDGSRAGPLGRDAQRTSPPSSAEKETAGSCCTTHTNCPVSASSDSHQHLPLGTSAGSTGLPSRWSSSKQTTASTARPQTHFLCPSTVPAARSRVSTRSPTAAPAPHATPLRLVQPIAPSLQPPRTECTASLHALSEAAHEWECFHEQHQHECQEIRERRQSAKAEAHTRIMAEAAAAAGGKPPQPKPRAGSGGVRLRSAGGQRAAENRPAATASMSPTSTPCAAAAVGLGRLAAFTLTSSIASTSTACLEARMLLHPRPSQPIGGLLRPALRRDPSPPPTARQEEEKKKKRATAATGVKKALDAIHTLHQAREQQQHERDREADELRRKHGAGAWWARQLERLRATWRRREEERDHRPFLDTAAPLTTPRDEEEDEEDEEEEEVDISEDFGDSGQDESGATAEEKAVDRTTTSSERKLAAVGLLPKYFCFDPSRLNALGGGGGGGGPATTIREYVSIRGGRPAPAYVYFASQMLSTAPLSALVPHLPLRPHADTDAAVALAKRLEAATAQAVHEGTSMSLALEAQASSAALLPHRRAFFSAGEELLVAHANVDVEGRLLRVVARTVEVAPFGGHLCGVDTGGREIGEARNAPGSTVGRHGRGKQREFLLKPLIDLRRITGVAVAAAAERKTLSEAPQGPGPGIETGSSQFAFEGPGQWSLKSVGMLQWGTGDAFEEDYSSRYYSSTLVGEVPGGTFLRRVDGEGNTSSNAFSSASGFVPRGSGSGELSPNIPYAPLLEALPFLTVCRSTWGELLHSCTTRVELLRGGPARRALLRYALAHKHEQVPLAVLCRLPTKGELHQLPPPPAASAAASTPIPVPEAPTNIHSAAGSTSGNANHNGGRSPSANRPAPHQHLHQGGGSASASAASAVASTSRSENQPYLEVYPFTDAELFQLYYLQLVFRAFFDIRLPGLAFHPPGTAAYSAAVEALTGAANAKAGSPMAGAAGDSGGSPKDPSSPSSTGTSTMSASWSTLRPGPPGRSHGGNSSTPYTTGGGTKQPKRGASGRHSAVEPREMLRGDLIAVQRSVDRGLLFLSSFPPAEMSRSVITSSQGGDDSGSGPSHSHLSGTRDGPDCVYFPQGSSMLYLLNMEEAVVPLLASAQEVEATAVLPLFGSPPPDMPQEAEPDGPIAEASRSATTGPPNNIAPAAEASQRSHHHHHGHHRPRKPKVHLRYAETTKFQLQFPPWASRVVIDSPHAAAVALRQLFHLTARFYGYRLEDVLSAVPRRGLSIHTPSEVPHQQQPASTAMGRPPVPGAAAPALPPPPPAPIPIPPPRLFFCDELHTAAAVASQPSAVARFLVPASQRALVDAEEAALQRLLAESPLFFAESDKAFLAERTAALLAPSRNGRRLPSLGGVSPSLPGGRGKTPTPLATGHEGQISGRTGITDDDDGDDDEAGGAVVRTSASYDHTTAYGVPLDCKASPVLLQQNVADYELETSSIAATPKTSAKEMAEKERNVVEAGPPTPTSDQQQQQQLAAPASSPQSHDTTSDGVKRSWSTAVMRSSESYSYASTTAAATAMLLGAEVLTPPASGAEVGLHSTEAIGRLPEAPSRRDLDLVKRFRLYTQTGDVTLFRGSTGHLEVVNGGEPIGRGGSGVVYKALYGPQLQQVAVKAFYYPPDATNPTAYVRSALTDVAFYVLLNQLDDHGMACTIRAYDFIVSKEVPRGLDAQEVHRMLHRNSVSHADGEEGEAGWLCYLVMDLVDSTLGKFLTAEDPEYDPWFDVIVNSPLRPGELFQFLYMQLVLKTVFDWRLLDMMLNGELRGDNIGVRYLASRPTSGGGGMDAIAAPRKPFKGLIVAYHFDTDAPMKFLRFSTAEHEDLRFILLLDLGQGLQPDVCMLTARGLIGDTVVASDVEDDGLGRYWPLEELYCRGVEVEGDICRDVVAWGRERRIRSREDGRAALQELFAIYEPLYGCASEPTAEELSCCMCIRWGPEHEAALQRRYVYRPAAQDEEREDIYIYRDIYFGHHLSRVILITGGCLLERGKASIRLYLLNGLPTPDYGQRRSFLLVLLIFFLLMYSEGNTRSPQRKEERNEERKGEKVNNNKKKKKKKRAQHSTTSDPQVYHSIPFPTIPPPNSSSMSDDKTLERLMRPTREPKELPPLTKTTIISKEQLDASIKRLYDDSIARKQQEDNDLRQRLEAGQEKQAPWRPPPRKTISSGDEDAMVSRLYEEAVLKKEQNVKELRDAEERQCAQERLKPKKVSKSEEEQLVDNLYREGMERERDRHIKLYQQFVVDRRKNCPSISDYRLGINLKGGGAHTTLVGTTAPLILQIMQPSVAGSSTPSEGMSADVQTSTNINRLDPKNLPGIPPRADSLSPLSSAWCNRAAEMDSTTSPALTLEMVAAWLQEHHYPSTALELYEESRRRGHPPYAPLLDFAASARLATGEAAAVSPRTSTPPSLPSRGGPTSRGKVPMVRRFGQEGRTEAAEAAVKAPERHRDLVELLRCVRATLLQTEGDREEGGPADGQAAPSPSTSASASGADRCMQICLEAAGFGPLLPRSLQDLPLRVQRLEAQLSSAQQACSGVVASLATQLPGLVHAIDAAQRPLLLPLMRVLFEAGSTAPLRAAGCRTMLRLYRAPRYEHRLAVAEEWSRVIAACVAQQKAHLLHPPPPPTPSASATPSLERELLPELFALVNASLPERRLLAVDCVVGMAPVLLATAVRLATTAEAATAKAHADANAGASVAAQRSVLLWVDQVRAAVFQGVLLPLSEDSSSTVRREVPRAISSLWWPRLHSLVTASDDVPLNTTTSTPAAGPESGMLGLLFSSASSQQPLERLVRLALDPCSASVRSAAQLHLREVVFPHCFERDGSVLASCLPVWVAYMHHETAPLKGELGFLLPSSRHGDGDGKGLNAAPRAAPPSTAPGEDGASAAVSLMGRYSLGARAGSRDESTPMEGEMALRSIRRQHPPSHWHLAQRNVGILIYLLRDAVAFLQAALANLHQQQQLEDWARRREALGQEFVDLVLPLTHALFVSCGEEATGFFKEQMQPLWCALAAELARLVPELGGSSSCSAGGADGDGSVEPLTASSAEVGGWPRILRYLQDVLDSASWEEESAALLFYSFLIGVAGSQEVFAQQVQQKLHTITLHYSASSRSGGGAAAVGVAGSAAATMSGREGPSLSPQSTHPHPPCSTIEQGDAVQPLSLYRLTAAALRQERSQIGLEAGAALTRTIAAPLPSTTRTTSAAAPSPAPLLPEGEGTAEDEAINKRRMLARVCGQCLCCMAGPATGSNYPALGGAAAVDEDRHEAEEEDEEEPEGGVHACATVVSSPAMAALSDAYAGIMAVIWSFAESHDTARRLQAVRYITALLQAMDAASAHLLGGEADARAARNGPRAAPQMSNRTAAVIRETRKDRADIISALQSALLQCVVPALLPLLHDRGDDTSSPGLVPEAAAVLLRSAAHLGGTLHVQEQLVMMPLFAMMESQPPAGQMTLRFVQQWTDALQQPSSAGGIPPELREAFLFPYLSRLTQRLVNALPTPSPFAASPQTSPYGPQTIPLAATQQPLSRTPAVEAVPGQAWVAVAEAVTRLLAALSRCVVVDNPVAAVHRHLMPAFARMIHLLRKYPPPPAAHVHSSASSTETPAHLPNRLRLAVRELIPLYKELQQRHPVPPGQRAGHHPHPAAGANATAGGDGRRNHLVQRDPFDTEPHRYAPRCFSPPLQRGVGDRKDSTPSQHTHKTYAALQCVVLLLYASCPCERYRLICTTQLYFNICTSLISFFPLPWVACDTQTHTAYNYI
eukprot:gene6769-4859_t